MHHRPRLAEIAAFFGAIISLLSCGGGGGAPVASGETNSIVLEWGSKTRALEKQADLSWILSWPAIELSDTKYYIFSAKKSEEFNFEVPISVEDSNFYTYLPENIFTEVSTCFIVRAAIADLDKNTNAVCTNSEPVTFSGITGMERLGTGAYQISWEALPINNVVYTVYERTEDTEYDFTQPSFDAIREHFVKLPVLPRGEVHCFVVRYYHPDSAEDINNIEMCTEEETPISFTGISSLTALSSTSVKVAWTATSATEIAGFKIYQGSDFTEEVGIAEQGASELILNNLVPLRQYSFGVRAMDQYDREDKNLKILSIIMPGVD